MKELKHLKKVTEKQIESRLVKRVKEIGGVCEKFTSPNRRSVPDRICTYDPEVIHFVECKSPGELPTPAQARDHERRRRMGFTVLIVDNYDAVEGYIIFAQQMIEKAKRQKANEKEIAYMMGGSIEI